MRTSPTPNHTAPTRHHSWMRRFARRPIWLLVIFALVMPAFVGAPTAGADNVTDLQAQADRIASQLSSMQAKLGALGEQFNQSEVRRQQIAQSKVALEQRSAQARDELLLRQKDASRYALSAYAGVAQSDALWMALDGQGLDLSRRDGYAAIRIGDREQIVDDLQAARQVNSDLLGALNAATASERRIAADLQAQENQASELVAQQQALQASLQGKLAIAVAQRQAEIAASQAAAPSTTSSVTALDTPSSTGSSLQTGSTQTTSVLPSSSSGAPTTTRPTSGPATSVAPPTVTTPPVTTPPVVTAPPIVNPPPATNKGQIAVNAALSQLGVRYSWGGGTASGPSYGFGPGAGVKGFDCSGLALYAWAQAGVYLYHSAQMQYDGAPHVSLSQLQPGDLVFYGSSATTIDHVAIYVGNGTVVHAPNSTTVVKYGTVNMSGYWSWIGAARPG